MLFLKGIMMNVQDCLIKGWKLAIRREHSNSKELVHSYFLFLDTAVPDKSSCAFSGTLYFFLHFMHVTSSDFELTD